MNAKKTKVVLDTSFLLVPFKFNLDIFFEVRYLVKNPQFIISKEIVNEIKNLSKKKGKTSLGAKFALKILKSNKDQIKIVNSVKKVDDWIVEFAKKNKVIVCTNDVKLKNSLKSEELKVIMVKSKSKVDFV